MYRISCIILLLLTISGDLSGQSERKLSLAEALSTAVERNLEIQLQRVNIESQNLGFNLSVARFEPNVTSSFSTNESDNEPRDSLQGANAFTSTGESFRSQFTKGYDFGFGYSVSLNGDVQNSGAESQLAGDVFTTQLILGFEQQILRGFSFDKEVYKKDQLVALRDVSIAEKDLEAQINTIIQQTENAYWDLVFAIEQLKVSQQSLDLAKQLYDQNKIKIDVGTMAPIELVNTEATVASRERDIIDAENRVQTAEDALSKIMNIPVQDWNQRLVPTEMLTVNELPIDEAAAYELARRFRPELMKSDLEEQKSLLDIKYNENQLKPELKLSGSYAWAGTDSNVLRRDPTTGDSELLRKAALNEALKDIYDFNFPSYNVQLALAWTPFNKQAKINLARSRVALKQAELRRRQTEIGIMEEVRGAVRDLGANMKAIRANEKSVRFQEENLKAEEQKFQNGLSTNFRVSEVQDSLSQARSTLIQSKVNYLKAIVSYHKAVGKLLEERQIAVQ